MSNKEYIEREAFLQRLLNDCVARYPSSFYIGLRVAAEEIGKQPTADVAEVRHGAWVQTTTHNGETLDYDLVCSVCGESGVPFQNYCSGCGAKMDGKGEGE